MMVSLADAWAWYESVGTLTVAMKRLGEKHWDHLPLEGALGRDSALQELHSAEILRRSTTVQADLDDPCVLLLFSVFEATVRGHVFAEIESVVAGQDDPAIRQGKGRQP